MRDPVTLLCLADLHCEKEKFEYFSTLVDKIKSFTNQLGNDLWCPDYLIVAGDIIFAKKKEEDKNDIKNKYIEAKKVINRFIDKFPQLKGRIIIIPGNHDNEVPEKLSEIIDARNTFLDYCKSIDSHDETQKTKAIEKFSTNFGKQFEQYLNFSECYNPPQKDSKYYDESIINNKIRDLAGVRIFEEHNLCFVPINTEWLYVPHSEIKKKIKAAIKKRNTNNNALSQIIAFLSKIAIKKRNNEKTDIENLSSIIDNSINIVENCLLCSPLIKDAYHSLVELHKDQDYTVVTVMHRGPEYLPWEDKNPTDKAKIDSLGMILNLSDILLTGHEHQTRTASHPSKIGNNVVHYNLGSVGRKEKNASEHVRWASLIHIDPLDGSVKHLPIEYDSTQLNWKIEPERISCSSLRNKYENDTAKEEWWRFGRSIPVLHVKSNIDAVIEEKIMKYYGICTKNKDIIINAEFVASKFNDSEFIQSVKDLDHNNQQMKIVVYYLDDWSIYGDSKIKSEQIIMKKIDKLRAEYAEFILLNKLIINEIIIKTKNG